MVANGSSIKMDKKSKSKAEYHCNVISNSQSSLQLLRYFACETLATSLMNIVLIFLVLSRKDE